MSVAVESISPPAGSGNAGRQLWPSAAARASGIAGLAIVGILTHLALRWGSDASPAAKVLPLNVVLVGGGVPLVLSLALKLVRREFGSDLLAGISIVAAVLLQRLARGRSGRRAERLLTQASATWVFGFDVSDDSKRRIRGALDVE